MAIFREIRVNRTRERGIMHSDPLKSSEGVFLPSKKHRSALTDGALKANPRGSPQPPYGFS